MIIQLEGPDGAGKTTLAHSLAKTWRESRGEASIIHTGPPGLWDSSELAIEVWRRYCYNRLYAVIDSIDESDSKLLVMDRGAWGSPVYGGLYRPSVNEDGFGDLGRNYFFEFERDLYSRGGVTALVLPDVETLIERSCSREDPYLDSVPGKRKEQLKQIHAAYVSFAETSSEDMPTFIGTFSNPTSDEIFEKIGKP